MDSLLSQTDREPHSPLTVMVQRSKITLPVSLLSMCEISDDSKPVTCADCGICVHKCKCIYNVRISVALTAGM